MPAILSNVPTRDRQLGGIAQLGERLTGSQEVSGSIPLISTRERHDESRVFLLVRSSWTERSAPVSGRTTKNKNWVLTITAMPVILSTVPTRDKQFGGIAQLGERLTGSQEVSGSIPLISTKKERRQKPPLFLHIFVCAEFLSGFQHFTAQDRVGASQKDLAIDGWDCYNKKNRKREDVSHGDP